MTGLIYIEVSFCFNIVGCIKPLQTVLDMDGQDCSIASKDLHYFRLDAVHDLLSKSENTDILFFATYVIQFNI